MVEYVTSGFVIAAFMLVYALLFFWVASQPMLGGREPASRRERFRVMSIKTLLIVFGFFYAALSFSNVYVTAGNTLFLTNQAPCENVIVNATDIDASTTVYGYADSCADRVVPVTSERLFVIMSWVMFLNFAGVAVGLMILIVRWMMR